MAPECDECVAIARELRGAYSEVLKDPKTHEFYSAIKEMFEGMIEEDGERLERIFEKMPQWRATGYPSGGPSAELLLPGRWEVSRPELTPIGRAMRRATIHSLRTGHKFRTMLGH